MKIKTFEDLIVYQKAMKLSESIYKATSGGPFPGLTPLGFQIRPQICTRPQGFPLLAFQPPEPLE